MDVEHEFKKRVAEYIATAVDFENAVVEFAKLSNDMSKDVAKALGNINKFMSAQLVINVCFTIVLMILLFGGE
jgi:hypothetical protein